MTATPYRNLALNIQNAVRLGWLEPVDTTNTLTASAAAGTDWEEMSHRFAGHTRTYTLLCEPREAAKLLIEARDTINSLLRQQRAARERYARVLRVARRLLGLPVAVSSDFTAEEELHSIIECTGDYD